MDMQLRRVNKKITALVVFVAIASVLLMAVSLYEFNALRVASNSNIEEIQKLVQDNSEVSQYLAEQKPAEAHFVTIANLIKEDQQNAIGQAVLVAAVPVLIVAGLISWFVSRYILRPVKEAYESQERFIQDAAHELRNPLAAMSLAIDNAKSSSKKNAAEFSKVIERQTKRLISMTQDLLFLERRTVGETLRMVNVSDLTRDVLEDLSHIAAANKVSINDNITDSLMLKIAPADYAMLAKNIIENAIKYSDEKGTVSIRLKQSGKKICLKVQDQGIGISEGEISRIGERFFRAKNTNDIDGSGLGFSIIQKIAHTYGAKVDLTSKLGEGTQVTVRF